MVPRCDQDCRTAQPVRSPARRYPGSFHRLKESQSSHSYSVLLALKFKLRAVSAYVQRWVYLRQLQGEFLQQLKVDLAKLVDVDLENIREVYEEIRGLLSSAGDVQTDTSDLIPVTALGEVLIIGKLIVFLACFDDKLAKR